MDEESTSRLLGESFSRVNGLLSRASFDTAAPILWRDDARREIPVIAVTAHAMAGDERPALDAGCDANLSKPARYGELLEMLREVLP